ncbi:glycosyltransferase family 2 protein [Rathayibacter tanaceti]|uniref:Glycosyltransferase n=2 Tax=Rathayibacter tanaceti TaxID=1671680 RepID=A0A166HT57_9MICO|nr:glycosyltransferase [Rathayibacter tanaceti]KZX21126.1 putative glycosyltransferase EpsE [Rathayibacter tanaceti]QHC55851.1 glycosyltransferase [Rathayibacter tanaceti]TCO39323.1 glycosyltransferase involved in cell wall biosynthesis [Rathayibacter tanaceti]
MNGVTVCITARNAEGTIAGSVRSALRALPPSGRVLVRDDGSTDGTAAAVARIGDRRLRILDDASPQGIPASRNALLEQVETPFVAILDGDDRAFPWRFSRQARLLAGGADLAFSTVIVRKPPIPLLKPQLLPFLSSEGIALALLLENPLMHPTLTGRTSVMRALDGYRSVAAEDFDLYLRASLEGHRLVRDTVPTVLYLRHAHQTTIDPDWIRSKTASTLVEEAFDDLGRRLLGFAPGWFSWRRAGFPRGGAPEGLETELRALLDAAAGLRPSEQRHLAGLVSFFRGKAAA